MGHSEVSMKDGDTVELLKVGCAGWWFVKVLGKQFVYFVYDFFLFTWFNDWVYTGVN